MEDPVPQKQHSAHLLRQHQQLPPSPPQTEEGASDSCDEIDIPLPPPTIVPTETLEIDQKTPDAHVPRDPRLIRLTGVHPFNVEPPLSALFKEGFLTSPELFYVRNHGAVPKVEDHEIPDWTFTVEGFVSSQSLHLFLSHQIRLDSFTSQSLLHCVNLLPNMSRSRPQ